MPTGTRMAMLTGTQTATVTVMPTGTRMVNR
jgi:hypothetical protein